MSHFCVRTRCLARTFELGGRLSYLALFFVPLTNPGN